MAGFRGQFLDGIHPNIIKRLDADTLGFQRSTAEEIKDSGLFNIQHEPNKTFRYLQERTVWMRTVPFAIPAVKYTQEFDEDKEEIIAGSAEADKKTTGKDGEAYRQASIDFTQQGRIIWEPLVPDWQDYVLYGGAHRPGTSPSVGYGGSTGLYRSEGLIGDRGTPKPGLTGIQVSNKGDMGTIRRCTLNIKAYSLNDLEELEMMYMVPGLTVLVEWGWYHPELYIDPIDLNMIKDGQELTNTSAINMEIIKKTLGVDDPFSIKDPGVEMTDHGPKCGIYDGLLGVITKFNWSNAADGTYDCRVDLISPGSLATGISTTTYAMGCSLRVDEQDIQIIDIRAIMAIIRKETRNKELGAGNVITSANFDELGTITKKKGKWGSGAEISEELKWESNCKTSNTEKINTAEYGVQFSVVDGKIEATVSADKSKSDGEYYVGDYQGGVAVEALAIKGSTEWWGDSVAQIFGVREFKEAGWWELYEKCQVQIKSRNHKKNGHVVYQMIWGSGKDGTWGLDPFCDVYLFYKESLYKGDYVVRRHRHDHDVYRDYGHKEKDMWIMYIRRPDGSTWDSVTPDGASEHHGKTVFNDRTYWFPIKFRDVSTYKANRSGKKGGASYNYIRPTMVHPSTGEHYNTIQDLQEALKGTDYSYGTPKSMVDNGLWKGNKEDGYTDLAGNPVGTTHYGAAANSDDAGNQVDATNWGSADSGQFANDSVIYRKVEGVTVYKKDENGKVTVVGHQVGTNSKEILKMLKKKADRLETDEIQNNQDKSNEFLKTEANIAASMRNGGVLSWLPKPQPGQPQVKPVIFSDDKAYNHVVTYSKHAPKHAPAFEIGYDIDSMEQMVEVPQEDGSVKKEKQQAPLYPIGCIAYTETYVSWRFIEDYIINEIYMPKTSADAEETHVTTADADLEIKFESVTFISDKEKDQLAQGEYIKQKHGDILDDSLDFDGIGSGGRMVKSQEIINHRFLRSFNPNVCILPGQESIPDIGALPDAEEFAAKIEKDIKSAGVTQLYLDDRSKAVDEGLTRDPLGKRVMRNGFAGIDDNGNEDYSRGILRNILINADLVGEAAESADNVRKFVMSILDAVNKACGKPWKFSIINVAGGNQIKVIDENLTPNAKKNSIEQTMSIDATANDPTIYKFSGVGQDNICKDMKIQSKLPSELQTMAYFGAMGASNEKGSGIQTMNMYRGAVVDRLKSISKVQIFGDSGDEETRKRTLTELIKNYMILGAQARYEVEAGLDKTEAIGEGEDVAEDFVKRYIHGDTVEVETYRPILPIDIGLTLSGISGIYMGNAIMVQTIDEGGLLPTRYKGQVALQATGVDHNVGVDGWSTSIGTLMRPLADVENKPTIIGKVPPVPPGIEDNYVQVTSGETPNADSLRKTLDRLPNVEEKFNKTLKGPKSTSKIKNDTKRKPQQGELASAAMHPKAVNKGKYRKDITATLARAASKIFTELATIPGANFKISAGNDYYHWVIYKDKAEMKKIGQKSYASRHCRGKGIDFVETKNGKGSEMLKTIDDILDRFLHANASDGKFPATSKTALFRFINEYDRPTPSASAGHFHISVGDGSEAGKEIDVHSAKRFKDKGGTATNWPYDKPASYYKLPI